MACLNTGAFSSKESNKDIYITQLIQRLESLHMSKGESTQKISLVASSSSTCLAQEPTTCWSQTKSSQVLKQQHKTQLRMLSHRWQKLGLQPPIPWGIQQHISDHLEAVAETVPGLEASPVQVTRIGSLRDGRLDEVKTICNSHCSSSGTFDDGYLEVNDNEQCYLNKSSRVSDESEDSDLSDQEKDNIPISKWVTPVELDLRPDSYDKELDPACSSETAEAEQVYPNIFPFPLKDLDLSQSLSSAAELKTPLNLYVSDSCLAPMVARLIELEKLQAATIQKEQGKAVRPRPATALARSANRLRKVESPCSQIEQSRSRCSNPVVAHLTKLTLSSTSHSRSRPHTHSLLNSEKIQSGVQQPSTSPKKIHSCTVKLRKTETIIQDYAFHSCVTPKCNSADSSKRRKPTKKTMPKLQKNFSEKTSVPSKAPCRKT